MPRKEITDALSTYADPSRIIKEDDFRLTPLIVQTVKKLDLEHLRVPPEPTDLSAAHKELMEEE